jgi:hypothetical protein
MLGLGSADSVLQLATGTLWDLGVLTVPKAQVSVKPQQAAREWYSTITDACDRHAY